MGTMVSVDGKYFRETSVKVIYGEGYTAVSNEFGELYERVVTRDCKGRMCVEFVKMEKDHGDGETHKADVLQ